jgi:hypothetical protein
MCERDWVRARVNDGFVPPDEQKGDDLSTIAPPRQGYGGQARRLSIAD